MIPLLFPVSPEDVLDQYWKYMIGKVFKKVDECLKYSMHVEHMVKLEELSCPSSRSSNPVQQAKGEARSHHRIPINKT